MNEKEVVLILQIGSLGDTVISLPCYREIARRHPQATRYLLTNFPVDRRWIPAEEILRPTGVIEGTIEYPMPLRRLGQMVQLRRRIVALCPSVLYYLLPERKVTNLIRHYAFFRSCGIRCIRGIPWSRDLRFSRKLQHGQRRESEACRLLRTLGVTVQTPSDADRDLNLSTAENAEAAAVLSELPKAEGLVAISVGGKVPLNDWGNQNWGTFLRMLSHCRPELGAIFVGSADERLRNDLLASDWEGPVLNACGRMSPRETAALISRADAFIGHDTGTLHLAAAVGTPIVGIFSARNEPGIWFSDRERDTFFYDHVACAGCRLEQIEACRHDRICMTSHDPAAVVVAVERILPMPRPDL